jgi:hypothetical protein
VAEGDRLQLVRGQAARFTVTPNGARRYALAVLQPAAGPVLRTGGNLVLVAQGINGIEPVEVARRYTFNAGHFDHPALDVHGVHLPADVNVPVRRFEVEVVDTVALLSSPDPRTAPLAGPAHPGDTVYVAVPVSTARALSVSLVSYPGGAPAPVTDPAPGIAAHPPSADVAPLVAPGNIYRITLGVGDPPEAPALIEFTATVSLTEGQSDVTALLALDPHFTLDAGAFTVARGARLSLTCSGGVSAGAVTVAPAAGIVVTTAGATVNLDVAAAAATGNRTVLVTDAADATHRARRTFTVT